MDQEIKVKWMNALNSGKYKQGKCVLRKHDEYCCLGVLCDLFRKDHMRDDYAHWEMDLTSNEHGHDLGEGVCSHMAYTEFPSQRVIDWAGLGDRYGSFELEKLEGLPVYDRIKEAEETYGVTIESLADLNDYNFTFQDISVVILKAF